MKRGDALTLLVLRHAKSSWKDPDLTDHDRPLNKRGRRDAPRMGRLLKELQLVPDRMLCSTANRACTTARTVLEAAGATCELELWPELYLASAGRVLELVSRIDATERRVMVVAHNPGLEELVSGLTGVPVTFPTAALAQIDTGVERWDEVRLGGPGCLTGLWKPRELPDEDGFG